MIKNIIYQQKEERDILLNQQYINRIEENVISEYLSTLLIKLITGPRRAGKSVLALQILKNQNFAYLNFDDELLLNNFEEMEILKVLNEVYGNFKYLLLDEIQNLPNWELWVNKLHRRNINIILTGSNANLLSRELATSLTGRYIQISVFPFSYKEFLLYNGIKFDFHNELTPTTRGKLLNLLNTYMQNGGFPEIILNPGILKNYLSSLFDSILLKDILKRFKIRQTSRFYELSNYLLSNYTNFYTANHLKEHLGFNSVATVQKFISYLEEPFLFFNLTKYDTKIRRQYKAPKKSYIIDNGFIKARSFELSHNYGRLLENLVFIELLRKNLKVGLDLFYYRTRNNREVDFLIRRGNSVEQLIQVCYDMSDIRTEKREINALIEASAELNCSNLQIINWDKEDLLSKNNIKVNLIPLCKWLKP